MVSSYLYRQYIPGKQPSMRWMSLLTLTLKLVQAVKQDQPPSGIPPSRANDDF